MILEENWILKIIGVVKYLPGTNNDELINKEKSLFQFYKKQRAFESIFLQKNIFY